MAILVAKNAVTRSTQANSGHLDSTKQNKTKSVAYHSIYDLWHEAFSMPAISIIVDVLTSSTFREG